MEQLINKVTEEYIRKDIPEFNPGDTVKVQVKIVEGDKERLQDFVGVVIRKRGSGIHKTFTVRKVSFGVGVEKVFPLYSPTIQKIDIIKRGSVRRAKLYYLRNRIGKSAKIKEKKEVIGN
jgi:large subunit ribosomal protein L19